MSTGQRGIPLALPGCFPCAAALRPVPLLRANPLPTRFFSRRPPAVRAGTCRKAGLFPFLWRRLPTFDVGLHSLRGPTGYAQPTSAGDVRLRLQPKRSA